MASAVPWAGANTGEVAVWFVLIIWLEKTIIIYSYINI